MSEEFSDELFAELFGFCILRPKEATLEKARMVNALFDALSHELGIESFEFFKRAGKTNTEHLFFLSNVASCPEDIILLAQRALAPNSKEREDLKKKKPSP